MSETTGRPIGADEWIKRLEHEHNRVLAPGKRGRKPRIQWKPESNDLFGKLSP